MKAIQLNNYGLSEELQLKDVAVPEITENQVLVKVYATVVSHLDLDKASGICKGDAPLVFPWIPGHSFAGTIENPGFRNERFGKGDAVCGFCDGGAFAEYVAVDIDKLIPKPEDLTFVETASLLIPGTPLPQAIHRENSATPHVVVSYPLEDAATAWLLMGKEDPALPAVDHGTIVLEVFKEFPVEVVE